MSPKGSSKPWWLIAGLCVFVACLNFKPSDPYLSQYLMCDLDTQKDQCSDHSNVETCNKQPPCLWLETSSTCSVVPCADVPHSDCGNDDYSYCEVSNNQC